MKSESRGFMNAELEAIRDNLACGHCRAIFTGSRSQLIMSNRGLRAYCSTTCFNAYRNNASKKRHDCGPCQNCGSMFSSKTKSKKFCRVDCYIKSSQFKEMVAKKGPRESLKMARAAQSEAAKLVRETLNSACLECGGEVYSKPSAIRKYCSHVCYRSYMAKRFDRYISNPEGLALPQCYDEFLDSEELPCLIEGCTWVGRHLSLHANQAHGIPADEFKRAAGFNAGTGVIARPLAELLMHRPNVGVALFDNGHRFPSRGMRVGQVSGYRSLEGREHHSKANALLRESPGPERSCRGCGSTFQQSTPIGRTFYCTRGCRDIHYAEMSRQKRRKGYARQRRADGTFIWVKIEAEVAV